MHVYGCICISGRQSVSDFITPFHEVILYVYLVVYFITWMPSDVIKTVHVCLSCFISKLLPVARMKSLFGASRHRTGMACCKYNLRTPLVFFVTHVQTTPPGSCLLLSG